MYKAKKAKELTKIHTSNLPRGKKAKTVTLAANESL